ncbi:Uncharacterised protein [Streptococcus equi subsp. equi]|uniref:MobA/VirD2-like nuclease domain-containing protein n=1 Tax=Streptococcus equi subsp. equi TaxID=148942 RepID=A0A380JMV5_9STRE|nr:hypothetical protein [Streptococcus equi]SUN43963.1 Uncharacterised protein [Streptococcus equi subsp. equi]
MANIYARETALRNVVGRSDYISNPDRQEEIVLHKKDMRHTWKEYADFEKANQKSKNANVQARETVVALPNELANDSEKLERFCDLLAKKMYGENRDYEYAVHWNQSRSNLHAHFIYSERERNLESKPKVYKRDLWADSKTGRTCKKDHPNAVLRAKKGEVMKDKDGNVRYDTEPFTAKDKRYNNKSWLVERNSLIQEVFKAFEYEIGVFDKETQIAQKKLYKGAKRDYQEYAENWNRKAKRINEERKEIEPFEREAKRLGTEGKALQKRLPEVEKARERLAKERSLLDMAQYSLMKKDLDKHLVQEYEKDSNALAKRAKPPFYKGYRARNILIYLRDIYQQIKLIKEVFEMKRETLYRTVGTIERYQQEKARIRREEAVERARSKALEENKARELESRTERSVASEGPFRVDIDQIREMNQKAIEKSKAKKQSRSFDMER